MASPCAPTPPLPPTPSAPNPYSDSRPVGVCTSTPVAKLSRYSALERKLLERQTSASRGYAPPLVRRLPCHIGRPSRSLCSPPCAVAALCRADVTSDRLSGLCALLAASTSASRGAAAPAACAAPAGGCMRQSPTRLCAGVSPCTMPSGENIII